MALQNNAVPSFLIQAERFGIMLGLDRMQALMKLLGHPESELKCIHVAGTNGKGSVVSYIANILAAAGYKVGVYTSPFLERFSERIRILDGMHGLEKSIEDERYGEIPTDTLFELTEEVRFAVDIMISSQMEHPTAFELVTAVAFLYFMREECDYIILETGLGGRLDATNIIASPVCSVITAIGYDHMEQLGDTIDQIAAEKAAIIKPGCSVYLLDPIFGRLNQEESQKVLQVVTNKAIEMHASQHVLSENDIEIIDRGGLRQFFRWKDSSDVFEIQMIGGHQVENAALAVSVLRNWIDIDAIKTGLRYTRWKGRNELLCDSPPVMLDGAHNPQGMMALCDTLNSIYGKEKCFSRPMSFIMGMMRDKDVAKTIEVFMRHLKVPIHSIFLVSVDNERTLKAEEFKAQWHAFCENIENKALFYNDNPSMYNVQGKISTYDCAEDACHKAFSVASEEGIPLICVGSLFLVGQIRPILIADIKENIK